MGARGEKKKENRGPGKVRQIPTGKTPVRAGGLVRFRAWRVVDGASCLVWSERRSPMENGRGPDSLLEVVPWV